MSALKIRAAFKKLYQNDWWSTDTPIPRYKNMETRARWKAEIMRMLDQNPTMTIQDISFRVSRISSWVAELINEARCERQAELWTCLVQLS